MCYNEIGMNEIEFTVVMGIYILLFENAKRMMAYGTPLNICA